MRDIFGEDSGDSKEFCRGRGASIAIVEIFLGKASKEKKPEQGKQNGYGFYQLDPFVFMPFYYIFQDY